MNPTDFLPWMIVLPLIGSVLNGLVLRPRSVRKAGVIATCFSAASFVFAVILAFQPETASWSVPWLDAGKLDLNWALRFDSLTCLMALFVSGIGTVIHLYSIGYMSEEPTPYRYFAYLNLFLFNMLLLVCADNLPVLFVGWEGVGLCSYLLIGYWYEDIQKSNAGMKAFILNRIGDAGFLLGIFLCFRLFGTLEFGPMKELLAKSSQFDLRWLNLAALFLFIGATGKSAQIPLFVWLPDAMAGPTPVSALIHAATMVTAGIYLIARMSFLFQVSAATNLLISTIGVATALMAALIATSQTDIKKVLAYSTVSQLGLMFLGLGQGAYLAAIFHVFTHAFFKALLFLGAGSVIHALSGQQDIRKMGGLRKSTPQTFFTFAIGTAAIAGIPPLAGFFSKDFLLYSVMRGTQGEIFWVLGSLVSLLTAFYMCRLFALVFLGSFRGSEKNHPHESPIVMTLPLWILALGSVAAGWVGIPSDWHLAPNLLEHWLHGVLPETTGQEGFLGENASMGIATLLAFLGSGLGLWLFSNPKRAEAPGKLLRPLGILFNNKFWIDELYGLAIVRPFHLISRFLSEIVDKWVIDAAVLLPGKIARAGGTVLSLIQAGSVQLYLLVMLGGTLAFLWYCLEGGLV